MQIFATKLVDLPVVSLQTGERIATTTSTVIDAATMRLVAFRANAGNDFVLPVVLMSDVREITIDCLVVNSHDAISEAEDIVRLAPLLSEPHVFIGKRVVTEANRALGSVEDVILDSDTMLVKKLYVKPKMVRAWFGSTHIIDREQILEVAPKFIMVKEAAISIPLAAVSPMSEP